jgi:hypothetical protein
VSGGVHGRLPAIGFNRDRAGDLRRDGQSGEAPSTPSRPAMGRSPRGPRDRTGPQSGPSGGVHGRLSPIASNRSGPSSAVTSPVFSRA